jgi:hypothetical protein
MRRIRLGKTGLEVNQLGFGGIPIQRLTVARAVRVVQAAADAGVDFFDTARGYDDSEDKIGRALRAGSRRDRVVLASKCMTLDRAGMTRAIDESLKALRTDWIDLYQIHGINSWEEFDQAAGPDGALAALLAARRQGKIRHLGVTSHSTRVLQRLLRAPPDWVETLQVPFNFVGDQACVRFLAPARRANLGFLAMKSLGGGVLERPDLALRYVLQFPDVVALVGIEKLSELKQNLRLAREARPLDPVEQRTLTRLRDKLGRHFCRKCQYCHPCPSGIPIHVALGAKTLLGRFNRRALAGPFRQLMRRAAACTKCGVCETRCPYKLPIRRLMAENVALFRRGLRRLGIPWEDAGITHPARAGRRAP